MKKTIILLLGVCLINTSCSDFLNEVPRHQWSEEQAMKTYDKAVQSVNGIYAYMVQSDALNQGLSCALATKSGILSITSTYDYELSYNQTNSGSISPSLWNNIYTAINCANLAINGIPKISDSAFPNKTAKQELIAEARFLRGYFHSIAFLNYCHWWDSNNESKFGLIYKDKLSTTENLTTPRKTVGDSWKVIFEDIDFAIQNMSDEFSTPRRVSKFFAKAYKAKLLLYKGTMHENNSDILESKKILDEILAKIPAGIQLESNYADLFKNSWDSKENIFVRYVEPEDRQYGSGYYSDYALCYSAFTNYLNSAKEKTLQKDAICGLKFGTDWIRSDKRWTVSTGLARKAETWDESLCWTWTKIYRKGKFAGVNLEPKDDKYATYYMRLAELYIMKAELIARTGGAINDAIASINELRSIRNSSQQDTTLRHAILKPTTNDELMDMIFKEYVCELILENGSEYYAALRFNFNGKRYIEEIKGANVVFDKNKIQWPIPFAEINNNGEIEQNPNQK